MIDITADSTSLFFTVLILALLAIIAVVMMGKLRLIATLTAFAYPNAKFNAMGNAYVVQKELKQLTASGSFQGAVEQVSGPNYDLKDNNGIEDIERKLMLSEIKFFKDIHNTVPKYIKPLVRCYLLKWEVRYLKGLLATRYFGKKHRQGGPEIIPEVELDRQMIDLLKETPSLEEAANLLTATRYAAKLRKVLNRSNTGFSELDRVLEEIFYEELNSVKSMLPRTVAKPAQDFINLTNDIANLKILLRAKKMGFDGSKTRKLLQPPGKQLAEWKLNELSEAHSIAELLQDLDGTGYYEILEQRLKTYNATGDLQLFEIALDRYYLNQVVSLAVESSLTLGPTIRFLISKEFETRNLMTVLRGLYLKIPAEKIISLTIYETRTSDT